ncbi:transposase [Escherichia coli]|uniref:transposase n=1 Tax=Escherichia coli TaxID=562 RepID=UPI001CE19E79|nr:transposase [Escherichia coli]MCA4855832.1 transposase [Escherichia coli]
MGNEKSLAHTRWNCKYHIVFAPKYRRQVFYREKRSRGYYVDTVGKNTAKIQDYIKHQLEEDKMGEQLSIPNPGSPFTGRK